MPAVLTDSAKPRALAGRADDLETKIAGIRARHPAVGFGLGVVRGLQASFSGQGYADVDSKTAITEDTLFRVGSITKTFTAIAVMQLWEQGLLDLDAPANDYLKDFKLISAKSSDRPATLRHLLTHTSGIAEMRHPGDVVRPLFGETVKHGFRIPRPAEYYGEGIRLVAEPGSRFVYTDHGFTVLGQIVEDVSGTPFGRYLREHVFEPLGMTDTYLDPPVRVRSRLATEYSLSAHGVKAIDDYEIVTAGGGGAYSTAKDMNRYVSALLGRGRNKSGSVLEPASLAQMFQAQYRPDPRVPGIGLPFYLGDLGGHPVVQHGGIVLGCFTEMWLAPDDGIGVIAFTNGTRLGNLWMPGVAASLLADLLGAAEATVRHDVAQRPEVWSEVCGWYELPAARTDVRSRAMIGAGVGSGVEVIARGGELVLRALSPIPGVFRGFVLHPDDPTDPYVFRIDLSRYGIGTIRVVFTREPGTGVTALSTDFMPISLRRQPAGRNPRRRLRVGLAAVLACLTVGRIAAGRHSSPSKDQAGSIGVMMPNRSSSASAASRQASSR